MKLELDFTTIEKRLLALEKQAVIVGVLDDGIKSASINWAKGINTKSGGKHGSYQTRYVRAKGRNKNTSLRKVAGILDAKKGIFSDVLKNPNNKELIAVAQEMAIFDKTAQDINRLKNSARALVRNPILRGDYDPNSKQWAKRKGFNHWGIATGTLFKNIEARYKKW